MFRSSIAIRGLLAGVPLQEFASTIISNSKRVFLEYIKQPEADKEHDLVLLHHLTLLLNVVESTNAPRIVQLWRQGWAQLARTVPGLLVMP